MTEREEKFDASRAELFEALGHPARVQILRALQHKSLGFAELKREVGIESSGHLQFHLGKLTGLVSTTPQGVYALTDDGREAIRVMNSTTGSGGIAAKAKPSPLARTRWTKPLLAVLLTALVVLAGITVYQQEQIVGLNNELSANGFHPPWLFVGAYAVYAGNTTGSFPANYFGCPSCKFVVGWNVRLQVENFNSTDVEMLYLTNQTQTLIKGACATTSCSGYHPVNMTRWYNIHIAPTVIPISLIGETLAAASDTTIVLNGHTYDVTLYHYEVAGGSTFNVYIYNDVGFPIMYSLPSNSTLSITIIQTNIPRLSSIISATA